MILIVDGSNVLGSTRLSDAARRDLVRKVAIHARGRRSKALLVFDGNPSEDFSRGLGHVQVRFSGAGSGDDLIASAASAAREPVVVITRDAELRNRVQRRGVTCEGPQRLLAAVAGREEETGEGSDWEEWFSDPSNRQF